MKYKFWIIFSIVAILMQYIFFQTKTFSYIELILLCGWGFAYYENVQTSLFYIFPASLIYELVTFDYLGVFALTFSFSLLILYLLKNVLNVISEDQRFRLVFVGIIMNLGMILLFENIFNSFIELGNILIGFILTMCIFIIFIKFIKIKANSSYET